MHIWKYPAIHKQQLTQALFGAQNQAQTWSSSCTTDAGDCVFAFFLIAIGKTKKEVVKITVTRKWSWLVSICWPKIRTYGNIARSRNSADSSPRNSTGLTSPAAGLSVIHIDSQHNILMGTGVAFRRRHRDAELIWTCTPSLTAGGEIWPFQFWVLLCHSFIPMCCPMKEGSIPLVHREAHCSSHDQKPHLCTIKWGTVLSVCPFSRTTGGRSTNRALNLMEGMSVHPQDMASR